MQVRKISNISMRYDYLINNYGDRITFGKLGGRNSAIVGIYPNLKTSKRMPVVVEEHRKTTIKEQINQMARTGMCKLYKDDIKSVYFIPEDGRQMVSYEVYQVVE